MDARTRLFEPGIADCQGRPGQRRRIGCCSARAPEAIMIAVIFELQPREGMMEPYLEIAAELRPILEQIDGFISVERFESLTTPGKYVSISFWRDEEAVKAWRQQANHRRAQHKGRTEIFQDYRLRVAEVIRDYTIDERSEAPADAVGG